VRPGLAIRKSTDFIAIHCSASVPNPATDVTTIDRWHRMRGFLMVGYHFVIMTTGFRQIGRPESTIGAHVEGYNARSIGICLIGGVDKANVPTNNFTPAQFEALAALLRELRVKYPTAVIQGHRDFPKVAKACPSFDVREWLVLQGIK
jgi:N-acetylmuramoyl-L-alanine amidase